MSSLNFITAIIAERLGYSRANALAIAEALSESDRDKIEAAAQDRGTAVTIAALLYGARMRAANELDDPEQRREAISKAHAEAAHHNRKIQAQAGPRGYSSPSEPRRRTPGLRVVREPPPVTDDPADC